MYLTEMYGFALLKRMIYAFFFWGGGVICAPILSNSFHILITLSKVLTVCIWFMILIASVLLILIIWHALKCSSHLEQAKYASWWEINPTSKLFLDYERDAANCEVLTWS